MFDGWLYLLIDGHLYNLPKIIFMEMISFSLNVETIRLNCRLQLGHDPLQKSATQRLVDWFGRECMAVSKLWPTTHPNKQTTRLLTYVTKPCVKPHQLSDQAGFRNILLWECEWQHRMGSMLLGNQAAAGFSNK